MSDGSIISFVRNPDIPEKYQANGFRTGSPGANHNKKI